MLALFTIRCADGYPNVMIAPNIVSYTARTITLTFIAPASEFADITSFAVRSCEILDCSQWQHSDNIPATSTEYTVTSLQPNVAYLAQVTAQTQSFSPVQSCTRLYP